MKQFYTLQEAVEALQLPVELSVEVRERMDRSVARAFKGQRIDALGD